MNKIITISNDVTRIQKRLFFIFSGTASFFIIMYMFFVFQIVGNVVARQNIVKTTSSTSSEVSAMDTQLMQQSNALTLNNAHILGLVDSSNADTIFVDHSSRSVAIR